MTREQALEALERGHEVRVQRVRVTFQPSGQVLWSRHGNQATRFQFPPGDHSARIAYWLNLSELGLLGTRPDDDADMTEIVDRELGTWLYIPVVVTLKVMPA